MTKRHDRDNKRGSAVKFDCKSARPLVPSYLDGELSEAQAAPLREHLFDCLSCREAAKDSRVLLRWFQDARDDVPVVTVPEGFAARVARRAFAGDPGLLIPAPRAGEPRRELLPFVLTVTAVAAALLLAFSIVIQRQSLPAAGPLEAQDYRPPWEERAADDRVPFGLGATTDRGALDEEAEASPSTEDAPDDPDEDDGGDER